MPILKKSSSDYVLNKKQYEALAKKYKNDPLGFINDIIMWEVLPDFDGTGGKRIKVSAQQKDVLESCVKSIKDRKPTSVKSGHGTGKTCVCSWIALWFIFTRYCSRGMITAPTERQLKTGVWQELKLWIANSLILSNFFVWGNEIIQVRAFQGEEGTVGGWDLELRTSSKPENVAGVHGKGGSLVIVDEASGITDEDIWTTLDGATTDKGSLFLMIGNPTQLYGRFYDSFFTQKEEYHTMTLSCEAPDYRGDSALIKKWLNMWGRNSDRYRVRALGEFPKSSADSLISVEELFSCFGRHLESTKAFPIISIDPSDSGNDSAEIISGNWYQIYDWQTIYGKTNSIKIADKVKKMLSKMRENSHELGFPSDMKVKVIIDVNGVGVGVRDQLEMFSKELNIEIISNKSSWAGNEQCERMKDWLWVAMKKMLEFISIPECKSCDKSSALYKKDFKSELESQICSRTFTMPNDKIIIESKEKLKARGLPSPDKGDSLSLYCWLLYEANHKFRTTRNYTTRTRFSYTNGIL